MKKRLVLAAMALALASCSSSTTAPLAGNSSTSSSSSGGSSGVNSSGASSGAGNSSSSFTALPTVDSSLVAGPKDLKVSTFVDSTTMVLTWTDIATLNVNDYSGYIVYRNMNYNGWDSIGTAAPQQQFFRDTTYKSMQYISEYRIIAYKKLSPKDSLVSQFSNQAGVVAVDQLAFGSVTFATIDSVQITRWSPSEYELRWGVLNKQPELGFIIQYLNVLPDTAVFPDSTATMLVPVAPTDWRNVDSLGANDNHYYVHTTGLFRVYAYYNSLYNTMISEFSPEVKTPRAYDPSITFTPPAVYTKVLDSNEISVSWNPTDVNIGWTGTGDSVWYEFQEVNGTKFMDSTVIRNQTYTQAFDTTLTDLCSFSIRVRIIWRDHWGVTDYSLWSPLSGTKPGTDGTLTDNGKICKQ